MAQFQEIDERKIEVYFIHKDVTYLCVYVYGRVYQKRKKQ